MTVAGRLMSVPLGSELLQSLAQILGRILRLKGRNLRKIRLSAALMAFQRFSYRA